MGDDFPPPIESVRPDTFPRKGETNFYPYLSPLWGEDKWG